MDIEAVVQAYLGNKEAQKLYTSRVQSRTANIFLLRDVTQRFIIRETDLKTFCSQLEKTLRIGEDWGATGFGFMMELNKFNKYHNETTNSPAEYFRSVLDGLNRDTLGPRIEQFHTFLLEERRRLRQEGKTGHMIVAPIRSSFILSLFAAWLQPAQQPVIYYDSLRKGLYKLVKAGLLTEPKGLAFGTDAVEVRTNAQHIACLQLIEEIPRYAPQGTKFSYWVEYFVLWVI